MAHAHSNGSESSGGAATAGTPEAGWASASEAVTNGASNMAPSAKLQAA